MQDQGSFTRPYRGLIALVIMIAVLSYFGFHASYWNVPRFTGTGWQVHFHVGTLVIWLGMLIAQGWLAYKGRINEHKRIGRLSYFLVPIIVLGFLLITDFGQRRHKEPALIGATIFDAGLFLLFYTMAIVKRKKTEQHARYMMLTPVAFMNPTLGRAISPEVSLPVQLVLLLVLFIVAKVRKRPWQPFAVALVGYFLLLLLIVWISFIQPEITNWIWETIWG
jgi:hypothetical protein